MKSQFIIASLPKKQLYAALSSKDRHRRVICGQVDLGNYCFQMFRGDGTIIHGSLKMFPPSGDETKPDFSKFKIDDYGWTVAFGDYEVASDVLMGE